MCEFCSWAPVCPCTNPNRSARRAAQILNKIKVEGIAYIPPEAIAPPAFKLRLRIDKQKLMGMAASIQEEGIIGPLMVRPVLANNEPRIELVLGAMRLEAAKLAHLPSVPCRVRRLTDAQALVISLVENLQRQDLTWAEEARALAELQRVTNWSGREIARRIGKSHRWVQERLQAQRTLEKAKGSRTRHKVTPAVSLYVNSAAGCLHSGQ